MKSLHHRQAVLSALYSAAVAADPEAGNLDWDEDKVKPELSEDDLKSMFTSPASDHPAKPTGNERLDRIIHNAGVAFAYGFAPANTAANVKEMPARQAAKVKTRDFIAFPEPEAFHGGMTGYRRTLAHELVHWSGAEERTGRRANELGMNMFDMLLGITPPGYAQEEMTADMGAALLLDELGEDPDLPARAHYVANWASSIRDLKEREQAYQNAKKGAEQAVEWLMQFDHA